MDATPTKLTGSCTKLERDSIVYYFLPHITIIAKNNILTVQSSSQHMLLERLTTPERGIYNIDFATLDTADKFGQADAVGLAEYWILNDYFVLSTAITSITPLDVTIDGQPIDTNITNASIAVTLDEPIDVHVTNTPAVTISGTVPVSFSQPITTTSTIVGTVPVSFTQPISTNSTIVNASPIPVSISGQPISVTDTTATVFDLTSTLRSYTNSNIATSASINGTRYACLGIKVVSGTIELIDALWVVGSAVTYIAEIWLNPTVAGTFTYTTFGTIQVANGVTANTVTGGTRLYTKFGISRGDAIINFTRSFKLTTLDTIVLTVVPQGNNASIYTSINYRI